MERVLTLAQSSAQQLVAFWALTGELPGLIDTLELTQVTRVAALVYVCRAMEGEGGEQRLRSQHSCFNQETEGKLLINARKKEQLFFSDQSTATLMTVQRQTDRQTDVSSHHCRQSHQAQARSPGHSDRGRYRRCYNTAADRGRPCHTHSHLEGGGEGEVYQYISQYIF